MARRTVWILLLAVGGAAALPVVLALVAGFVYLADRLIHGALRTGLDLW